MKRYFLILCFFNTLLLGAGFQELSNEEALSRAKAALSKRMGNYCERVISRAGNKTIVFEAFISMETDATLMPKILSDIPNLPKWAIRNINVKPTGGNYLVKIHELKPDPADTSILHGLIGIELPVFKTSLNSKFKITTESKPKVFIMRGEMHPDANSLLDSANAIIKAFPAENQPGYTWFHVYSAVKLRPWLLYEALPERLLKKESGDRVQIVLDNYTDEEERRRSSK